MCGEVFNGAVKLATSYCLVGYTDSCLMHMYVLPRVLFAVPYKYVYLLLSVFHVKPPPCLPPSHYTANYYIQPWFGGESEGRGAGCFQRHPQQRSHSVSHSDCICVSTVMVCEKRKAQLKRVQPL